MVNSSFCRGSYIQMPWDSLKFNLWKSAELGKLYFWRAGHLLTASALQLRISHISGICIFIVNLFFCLLCFVFFFTYLLMMFLEILKIYWHGEYLGKFPELFWRLTDQQNQLLDGFYLLNDISEPTAQQATTGVPSLTEKGQEKSHNNGKRAENYRGNFQGSCLYILSNR